MAENNPFDMLSQVLANPEALGKMGALFGNKAEDKEELPPPNLSLPSFGNAEEDSSTRLLHALEPFLSSRRRQRIPQMLQAMQIGKMLGGMQKK